MPARIHGQIRGPALPRLRPKPFIHLQSLSLRTPMNRLLLHPLSIVLSAALLAVVPGLMFDSPALAQEQAVQANESGRDEPDSQAPQPIFRSISAVEAAQMIDSGKDVQIIDVRTPEERKQFRIADTQLVPVGDVIRGVFRPDLDQPLILLCAVGGRSYVAGKFMSARGYREIYNMEGGIESWRRAGLPLETGPEEPAD